MGGGSESESETSEQAVMLDVVDIEAGGDTDRVEIEDRELLDLILITRRLGEGFGDEEVKIGADGFGGKDGHATTGSLAGFCFVGETVEEWSQTAASLANPAIEGRVAGVAARFLAGNATSSIRGFGWNKSATSKASI